MPIDELLHIIQVSLTPVFLLSGIAALLNVFATRLARVADKVDQLTDAPSHTAAGSTSHRLERLRRRSQILDAAVVIATIGAVSTGVSCLTLFVGALRNDATAVTLFVSFGFAVVCTIVALLVFLFEAILAGTGIRRQVDAQQTAAGARASGSP